MAPDDTFGDLLTANARQVAATPAAGPPARAARNLAVVTCMDPRLDPSALLGLRPGDAVVLRNAGGRVTDDVITELTLARHLLGVDRVMVVAHTDCRMAVADEGVLHDAVARAGGPDTRALSFLVAPDQRQALRADVERLRSSPYLAGIAAAGFICDVASGALTPV